MSAARPCPFCGGPAKVVKDERLYFVGCVECDMMTCEGEEEVAVEKWNHRATDALSNDVREILIECMNQCEAAIFMYETDGDLIPGDIVAKLVKARGMRDRITEALAAIRKHREEVGG